MASHGIPSVVPIPASAGMGLRFPHHAHVVASRPSVPWFEVHPENYLAGGHPLEVLTQVRADYPISFHAVGISLGGVEPPDPDHLARLSSLIDRVEPGLVSDHLSWSSVDGEYFADLLPLPYTEEALSLVARNVDTAQAALGRPLLIENPSRYLEFTHSTMSEAEFLGELARRTGCSLLCDVNNIYVSARNLGLDPAAMLESFPAAGVREIHLAGHATIELPSGATVLIDNHGAPIAAEIWQLFDRALERFGPVPTLIERDVDIPPFPVLEKEMQQAQAHIDRLGARQDHDYAA